MTIIIPAIAQWLSLIVPISASADVDWRLTACIIYVESRGDPAVVSPCGARGLMGVMPYSLDHRLALRDPAFNVADGTAMLRVMLDATGDDVRMALVAYHMGLRGAERAGWLQSDAGAEYVRRIAEAWRLLFPGQPVPWAKARPAQSGEQE